MKRDASAKSVQTKQTDLIDEASVIQEALLDKTRNSKYRLYHLERQFYDQKQQSKDKINGM